MKNERLPHDASYKQIFSNPDMVASLLWDLGIGQRNPADKGIEHY